MATIKLEKRYPHIADEDVTEIFNAGYLQGWKNSRRKAIPIEWITDWLTKQTIPATSYGIDYSAVEKMLEDWEKENEAD